ncbi:TRAP transporter small permease [Jannaschia aquimarina]|uniref:TRAP transporter small permease protein n=1 Tax=Jannaschia aquimarina TaxID=935700 RepID=A0A0D1CT45_9RHOB|nr:TRAP transporter small permease [Jannaschia aquimarina]KIT17937.1 Tripartite ATP-independent periplasmic transporter, DctQ component [Jannaschia aquimarina]SNT08556.1 TRAP-type C4-dicarboxylate transport system, small permease component [Jannaschia aquimarina]
MTVLDRLTGLLGWVAAALFVLAGAMLTWEVIARYFFVRPTIWAAELSQYCLIWGCMLAMAGVLRMRRHIAVTAGLALMPPGGRKAADLAALAAVLVFSVVVTIYGWEIFYDSWVRGRTAGTMLDPPVWTVELAAPIGFALLAVQCVAEMARTWRDGAPEPGGHE